MAQEILGCSSCGWVARPDLFEGSEPTCVECGRPLAEMTPAYARRLVAARRRADERRAAAAKAAELELHRSERRDT